jgi:hypothetical protein
MQVLVAAVAAVAAGTVLQDPSGPGGAVELGLFNRVMEAADG